MQHTKTDMHGLETGLLLNEVQLLLAEKRTALSVMRTGIAIFALPLSVLSVVIATSKYYDAAKVLHLIIPVLAINLGLTILATYLVVRSIKRFRTVDRMINDFKHKSKSVAELVT